MSKLLNCIGISAVCGFFSSMSAAEENGAKDVEEVRVWGTEINASSVLLDQDHMAIRQADHVSDLLRTIPGIDVGGAHSLNQRITIRSMDDKDLRITIDGANQNTYMYHHMGNLQIHADILKSVDIDVGNNSVVNGGLGGAVRFETRSADELLEEGKNFGARFQATTSNNASTRFGITTYGNLTDSVNVLAYYNSVNRDNYTVGGGKILDPNGDEIPGTDGEVRGLEGELSDLLFKVGWDIDDSQRLKLGYESYSDEGDYSYRPDMGLATDLAIATALNIPLVYPTKFSRDTLTLNYDVMWGDGSTLRASLFQNTSTMWRDERGLATWRPPLATINEGEAKNTGLNILAESPFSKSFFSKEINHALTYGVELIRYDTSYSVDGSHVSGEEATNSAIFVEDKIALSDTFVLIPGLRYDSYDVDTSVVSDTFSDITYAFAGEYQPTDKILLRASTTQLFKGPEVGEVFIGAGLYDDPNPEIVAESGMNSELAAAYNGKTFSAGITVFQTDIDDYIYDYSVNGKDNVGDMKIEGYEAYGEFTWDELSVLLSYSSSESELSAFAEHNSLDGMRIDRSQGATFSVNVDYEIPSLNVFLHWETQVVDDVDDGLVLDGPSLDASKDGFTLHNVSARWVPSNSLEGLTLTLGVDNLLDEFYASQSSQTGVSFHPLFGQLYLLDYEPGRNVKATVSYQF